MAAARMPEEFYDVVAHHLPPEKPVGPKGGRPRVGHRTVLGVIWFVLATGNRWEDVPQELGCSGRTAHRRLRAWEEAGVWDRLHADLLRLLKQAGKLDEGTVVVDGVTVRAFGGGDGTGPNPTDRGRKGTKHTLLVDRKGVPLRIKTAGANASDHTQILPLVRDFPKVGGTPGRPKEMPDELYADRGYDSSATRWVLEWLGIDPHIAKRNTAHGSGLGKVRWVVERTISWLKGLRRMRVRYDRLRVIQEAWDSLAASVICFRILHDELPLAA
jgi:transposase